MSAITSLHKVGGLGLVAKLNEQENALRRSELKFSLAFKAAADGIAITRLADGTLIDVNDSYARIAGYTREELIGKTTLEIGMWLHSQDRDQMLARLALEGAIRDLEITVRKRDGEIRVGLLAAEAMEYDGERCIVAIWHDITERKAAEDKLKLQNEYLFTLHETALALLERRDVHDLLEAILRRAGKLVGTSNAFIDLADEKSQTLELIVGAGMYAKEAGYRVQFGEGLSGRVFQSAKPLLVNNYAEWEGRSTAPRTARLQSIMGVPLFAAGKTIGVLGVSNPETRQEFGPQERDQLCRFGELASIALDNAYLHQAAQNELEQRKIAEKELRYINVHDSLTGLYNRARFEEKLCCVADGQAMSAIIICDVDGLKLINDSMGHQRGDALLIAAADILRQAVPADAFCARIGGDEFAIILSEQVEGNAEAVCQMIRQLVEERNLCDPNLPLSISTGYATRSERDISMAQMFKDADDLMYREKLHRSQSVRSTIVGAMQKALEARDFITEGHGERMQSLAVALGEVAGLSKRALGELSLSAQFHDIGKVGIPDRILFKPGPLTQQEYSEMKRHCEIGHRIALSTPDLAPIAKYILHHHEWWNGLGYPMGLKGNDIPLECRILAIVDAYDAMTSNRPYRQALTHKQAIAELKNCSGKQFDPRLTAIFVGQNDFVG
ncbi:MAG: diguanylate cyclase with sensor [Anaerosporomusa subterranea]|nr:diguanylate cyclase with sensor [Anaerosporomusa subterranea]